MRILLCLRSITLNKPLDFQGEIVTPFSAANLFSLEKRVI